MTGTIEDMEKLISEADTRFSEKLRNCLNQLATNMNVYSDRTYNLRQQVALNAQLTSDEHFMEMLEDTEQYLSPEYASQIAVDKKLTSLLAGLMKTLLREAVSQPCYSLRKVHIEMIRHWYQHKSREILEFFMKRSYSPAISSAASGGLSTSEQAGTSRTSPEVVVLVGSRTPEGRMIHSSGRSSILERPSTAPASKFSQRLIKDVKAVMDVPDLTFAEDAAQQVDEATIQRNLSLYKRRNLMKAESMRKQWGLSEDFSPKVVMTKDAAERQRVVQESKSAQLRNGASGPSPYLHHEALAPQFVKPQLPSTLSVKSKGGAPSSSTPPGTSFAQPDRERTEEEMALDIAIASTHKYWIAHMANQLEQESDKKALQDAVCMLSFNQARIHEESFRRIESDMFSSQLGRTHSVVRRRVPSHYPTPASGGFRFKTDSIKPTLVSDLSLQPSANIPSEHLSELLGHVTYQGGEVSLSPYDQRRPTKLDEIKIQSLLSKIQSPDNNDYSTAARKRLGLTTSAPHNVCSTGSHQVTLDVIKAPDCVETPVVPRLDVPVMELLFGYNQNCASVPSHTAIQQLKTIERVREVIASTQGNCGKRKTYLPRSLLTKGLLSPQDLPYSECIRMLPFAGGFLPRNPNPPPPEKKGKKK